VIRARHLSRRNVFFAVAAVSAMTIGVLALISSETGGASEPRPGLTAGVSALDRLPPAATLPDKIVEILGVLPPAVVDKSTVVAKQRVRLLRSDLGVGRTGFYAFRSKSGSVCFIVEEHSAVCPSRLSAGEPGLLWSIGGGTETVPAALVGVAADNVASIGLIVDRVPVPVTIKNNAAFAELPPAADTATITIVYADGQSPETTMVHLQG
jgi:hypothetical protein